MEEDEVVLRLAGKADEGEDGSGGQGDGAAAPVGATAVSEIRMALDGVPI